MSGSQCGKLHGQEDLCLRYSLKATRATGRPISPPSLKHKEPTRTRMSASEPEALAKHSARYGQLVLARGGLPTALPRYTQAGRVDPYLLSIETTCRRPQT